LASQRCWLERLATLRHSGFAQWSWRPRLRKSERNNSLQCMHLHFALRFIWQTANSAPKIKETLPARARKSHAHELKNPANNTQKEECCNEAFEENLRLTGSDFQTG
jgi:hypothetical protein